MKRTVYFFFLFSLAILSGCSDQQEVSPTQQAGITGDFNYNITRTIKNQQGYITNAKGELSLSRDEKDGNIMKLSMDGNTLLHMHYEGLDESRYIFEIPTQTHKDRDGDKYDISGMQVNGNPSAVFNTSSRAMEIYYELQYHDTELPGHTGHIVAEKR